MIINNLSVSIDQKAILHDINLSMNPGSLHVLMGPNGSGKSTLAYTLMGHPSYTITSGTITLDAQDITHLSVDKKAQAGLFLAFQHPYEIPGISVFTFLKEAHHAITKKVLPAKEFQELLYGHMDILHIDHSFAYRQLNYGFSGGEKKKLELLQMLLLGPKLAILDEIDSGLDVDATALVAQAIVRARQSNPALSLLIITHYPRLLNYLTPDWVHIMDKGKIIQSGPPSLAHHVEQKGYDAHY